MLIEPADPVDAPEILALQRLAYRSEADLNGDDEIPPLTQTIEQLVEEFGARLVLRATEGGRIVGSVRAQRKGDTCHVGRLIVHPDHQGRGLGTRLMAEVEARFPEADRFELFTGSRSARNLRLYERLGYVPFRGEVVSPTLTLVYLEKRPGRSG
jgi:ribosomal protein S18 acetylase RimI-like enzyme